MNERGLVAVASVEAVDDANVVGLEPSELGSESIDRQREVVEALAAPADEPLDEASRAGALDELDLEVADREVGPAKFGRVAVAASLPRLSRAGKFSRKNSRA
jgi:hypothetical protein